MFPVVTDLANDGIAGTVSCRVLDLCRQQYYRWLQEPITVGDRAVWRIASENGWWCSFGKKIRRASSPATAADDDQVRRVFSADGPNQVWVADLTAHRSDEGKI